MSTYFPIEAVGQNFINLTSVSDLSHSPSSFKLAKYFSLDEDQAVDRISSSILSNAAVRDFASTAAHLFKTNFLVIPLLVSTLFLVSILAARSSKTKLWNQIFDAKTGDEQQKVSGRGRGCWCELEGKGDLRK